MESLECIADVVILTILPEENRAVFEALQQHGKGSLVQAKQNWPNQYSWYTFPVLSPHGPLRIAVGATGRAGNDNMQAAVTDGLQHFHPTALLIVGVAGGLPKDDDPMHAGDIVIGDAIWSVDRGKITGTGTASRPVSRLGGQGMLPGMQNSWQFGDWHAGLFNADDQPPQIITGGIAASNYVITVQDHELMHTIRATTGNTVRAVEMESWGAAVSVDHYATSSSRNVMLGMVRGLSDIVHTAPPSDGTNSASQDASQANSDERNQWKQKAANNAARFVVTWLTHAWTHAPRSMLSQRVISLPDTQDEPATPSTPSQAQPAPRPPQPDIASVNSTAIPVIPRDQALAELNRQIDDAATASHEGIVTATLPVVSASSSALVNVWASHTSRASDALSVLLKMPHVWASLSHSGFVADFQSAARSNNNNSITLNSGDDVYSLCCFPGVGAQFLMARIHGFEVIEKLGRSDATSALNAASVDAIILICYVLAERMIQERLDQVGTIRSKGGRLSVPVKDQALAIIVGSANLSAINGERMYGGVAVSDGKFVIPGAIAINDIPLQPGYRSIVDELSEVVAESCRNFECAVPGAKANHIMYGPKGKEISRNNDGLKTNIDGSVTKLRRHIQEIYGVACGLVLTFHQSDENQSHWCSTDEKRQQIEEFFGVPTLVHGSLSSDPELMALMADVEVELARLLMEISKIQENVRKDKPGDVEGKSMTITTLAISFSADDQASWNLMRPLLTARLKAHVNPNMKRLKIWTFREIEGGKNDDATIQGAFRADTSAGLLLVSINACASDYIQNKEWPLFRDANGNVLKPFVAVMFSKVDTTQVDLGVLRRNDDGNRTQLLHVPHDNEVFSWEDCVNYHNSSLRNRFMDRVVKDLETQLFGAAR